MVLKIASRKSDLARLQAYQVGKSLEQAHSDLEVLYHFRQSLGDINQDDPLWKMPEKGVFTEDFREGLVKGEWDMVVHSWKDLPVEIPEGTEIVATLPRADMRDLFLLKKSSLSKTPTSLKVFTSSPRRIYNLDGFFKKYLPFKVETVEFQSVRGNIATRIQKLFDDDDIDGLVVAKAAIDRLLTVEGEEFKEGKDQLKKWLEQSYWMALPLSLNPTAAAQGALAVEIVRGRGYLKKILKSVHCQGTWEMVQRERKILKSYGGGCHQKIGVSCLRRDYGDVTYLQGLTDQGENLDSVELLTQAGEKFSTDESFPQTPTTGRWFDRREISYERPTQCNGHFVARANAVPVSEKFSDKDIVWSSGLKTWYRLAQRGIWVNGSCESLGEKEDKRLHALASDVQWVKWTHDKVAPSQESQVLATYKLVSMDEEPDVKGKKNFYWMSGSSFRQAISSNPNLIHETHYCGPGNTYAMIQKLLEDSGGQGSISIALSFEHWKKSTWKEEL